MKKAGCALTQILILCAIKGCGYTFFHETSNTTWTKLYT